MRIASATDGPYLHALKYRWLTPFYDPVMRWMFRDVTLKRLLVEQVDPKPGDRILDIGCGTGTLAVLLKRAEPGAVVTGMDGDPDILNDARRKGVAAGVRVEWEQGLADSLPRSDGALDVASSSLVLHHLTRERRGAALKEVNRVLRPGGRFHVAEFGVPGSGPMRALAKVSELLEETKDRVEGRFPESFRDAGFTDVMATHGFGTPTGRICLLRTTKPPEPRP